MRCRQTVDTIEDLLQYGSESRLQLLRASEAEVDASQALRLGCASGIRCIKLDAVRSERGQAGRPFAFTHVWFPPQPARKRDKLLRTDTAIATLLSALDARTLGRIEQTFTAEALDADMASHLQVRKGAPTLRVDRAYFNRQGALILLASPIKLDDARLPVWAPPYAE